ncbi:MAG: hypothetical protein FWH14_01850 [Oscillospiraceae bacterium]|nr:hypothetical protein [Oscillospiraceae bacterium]
MLKTMLERLKKPSCIISIISHMAAILIIMGVHLNLSAVTTVATLVCSILVTLGILSNPDTVNKGYGDDLFKCADEAVETQHVQVNGQMVCKDCGAVYAS